MRMKFQYSAEREKKLESRVLCVKFQASYPYFYDFRRHIIRRAAEGIWNERDDDGMEWIFLFGVESGLSDD